MPTRRFSDNPAASTLTGAEIVPGTQGGVDVKMTAQAIANLAGTGMAVFDVTDYGATGDGTTDDTEAIQDAIDACEAAGGGTVFFPAGIYVVGGALLDTSRSNSQILLPRRHTGSASPLSIRLLGEVQAPPIPSVAAAVILPTSGSIIKCTLNTGSGTSPACIGGHGPSGSAADFSNTHVVIENLTIRMPVNPVLTAVDLSHMACAEIDAVVIDSGQYDVRAASLTEPTTTSSYGLVMPKQSNGAHSVIGSCDVIGFYYGYQFAEHTNGVNVNAWGCKRAFQFSATDHASVFQRVMACHCEQVLVAGSGAHRLQIQQLNVEHAASGWNVTDYDINDASGYLYGDLAWHVVLAGVGDDSTFTVNGAANLTRRRVGYARAPAVQSVTSASTVTPTFQDDLVRITAQAAGLTLANPTGTAMEGHGIVIRIKDNGTARAISYDTQYRAIGITLPTTTVLGKTTYLAGIWNASDTKLDIVATGTEA